MNDKYSDIINMKRPKSKYEKMSIKDRAAQFAPFAALAGHKETLNETARHVQKKIELSEDMKIILNEKIKNTVNKIKSSPMIKVRYFEKDRYKNGGIYKTEVKKLVKYDEFSQKLIFDDKSSIDVKDILNISIFEDEEDF